MMTNSVNRYPPRLYPGDHTNPQQHHSVPAPTTENHHHLYRRGRHQMSPTPPPATHHPSTQPVVFNPHLMTALSAQVPMMNSYQSMDLPLPANPMAEETIISRGTSRQSTPMAPLLTLNPSCNKHSPTRCNSQSNPLPTQRKQGSLRRRANRANQKQQMICQPWRSV